ncbi:hypothetical protein EfmJHP38_02060 [Enterococcus faecium]|nr:hypothetical protein EfmJHP38_02060 [Enterococcus faecium]
MNHWFLVGILSIVPIAVNELIKFHRLPEAEEEECKVIEKEKTKTIDVQAMIDDLAEKANAALKEMESFDQEKVDHIVHEMAMAALDQHMPLVSFGNCS